MAKADGGVLVDVNLNVSQANKQLAKLKDNIIKTEDEVNDLTQKQEEAQNQSVFKAAELDAEKAKLQEIKDRLVEIRKLSTDKTVSLEDRASYKDQIPFVREELSDQQTRVRQLQTEYNKIDSSVEKYGQKLEAAQKKLEQQTEQAGALAGQIAKAESPTAAMSAAVNRMDASMAKFSNRIKKLASRVFVFTMITSALRGLRTWMGQVIETNEEARQSMAQLKGALLTLAQPLVEILIPAFTALVNVLNKVITAIGNFVAKLFGKSYDQMKNNAKALYDEQKALKATGKAADEAAGSLAGFDEINQINTESSSGVGGAANGDIEPSFMSGLIDAEMEKITALVGGALLALGAILTFSGVNIPLGLSLMALGAAMLASVVEENWGAIQEKLQGPIGIITALVSGALLVVGAILVFSGAHIGLGLGLMVAGAIGLAATIAANWDTIENELKGPIGVVVGLLSGALLVLGGVLAFSGANVPLGLALMAAGAAGLVTVLALNWDTIKNALEGPVGYIVTLVSGALLMLGVVLAFSGAHLGLGLALIAAGAVGLATSIAANWDTIKTAMQGPIGKVTGLISGALLALGAILAFTGVALPLGLGLMVLGAAGLATAIIPNWETIKEKLGGTVEAIATIVSGALLVLGVILLFTGAGIPLGLGLIAGGAAILASPIAPKWDSLLNTLKEAWNSVKNWWNDKVAKYFSWDYWFGKGDDAMDGLADGIEKASKKVQSAMDTVANISATVSRAVTTSTIRAASNKNTNISPMMMSMPRITADNIPRLATGTVIPPNREFLAVLGDQRSGTNIEAPLSTIEQAVENVLARNGGGGGDIHITVELDGKVVARQTLRHINNMTRQAGKPVLLI